MTRLLAVLLLACAALPGRVPTIDDLLNLKRVTGVSISPDGR